MNDRPEQCDWLEPVQNTMSDEDFAMIVQTIDINSPEYRAGRARRIAALKEIFGLWSKRNDIPKDGLQYQRLMREEWG
jgi:hypothetical protein